MTFEETLAALLGMNGSDVEVAVAGKSGDPALAAVNRGRLSRADELPAGLERGEENVLFFTLGEGTGFFLDGASFLGARWTGPSRDLLEIDSGNVRLVIEQAGE